MVAKAAIVIIAAFATILEYFSIMLTAFRGRQRKAVNVVENATSMVAKAASMVAKAVIMKIVAFANMLVSFAIMLANFC